MYIKLMTNYCIFVKFELHSIFFSVCSLRHLHSAWRTLRSTAADIFHSAYSLSAKANLVKELISACFNSPKRLHKCWMCSNLGSDGVAAFIFAVISCKVWSVFSLLLSVVCVCVWPCVCVWVCLQYAVFFCWKPV